MKSKQHSIQPEVIEKRIQVLKDIVGEKFHKHVDVLVSVLEDNEYFINRIPKNDIELRIEYGNYTPPSSQRLEHSDIKNAITLFLNATFDSDEETSLQMRVCSEAGSDMIELDKRLQSASICTVSLQRTYIETVNKVDYKSRCMLQLYGVLFKRALQEFPCLNNFSHTPVIINDEVGYRFEYDQYMVDLMRLTSNSDFGVLFRIPYEYLTIMRISIASEYHNVVIERKII